MPADQGVPQFQVTARMLCRGNRDGDESGDPLFTVEMVLQAVYRQFRGEPVDFQMFSSSHASLTRQLYPLIHHQLKGRCSSNSAWTRSSYPTTSPPRAPNQPVNGQVH